MPKAKNSAVEKRIRRRNRILLFFAVIILVTVSLFTPIFGVSSIMVEGNKILSDEAVIKASGIVEGDNLFFADTDKSEKKINALGYVKKVKIKRKFLTRIVIEVTENTEAAYMTFSGNYVGISVDGKILSITKTGKLKPKKAVITGCALKSAKKGEIIEAKKPGYTEEIKFILKTLDENSLISSVKGIDVTKLNKISFTLTSDTKIIIGESEQLDYKLKCLVDVMDELGEVRGGKIDISNPSNIIYAGGN